ncbi:differentially expressed in FDCP 8 homolog isoform X2 [Thrips palmi]|uniref:Differentially expressed in FDCP 8 homolog isoform X2 n=1 Tax=Thrips palmi TaxID=161013 RepID=A0A6P9AEF1_THRPL|nr:differentially expressed in FDCP 8 homolog isoform X2 [Thrips palmi]
MGFFVYLKPVVSCLPELPLAAALCTCVKARVRAEDPLVKCLSDKNMEASENRSDQDDGENGQAVPAVPSPASSISGSGALSDDSSERTIPYPFLDFAEDSFIQAALNLTTVEELSEAVKKCEKKVLDTREYSEERKWLVRYLIELRLRLQEAHEAVAEHRQLQPIGTPDHSPTMSLENCNEGTGRRARDKRIILGHHFTLQAPARSIYKCDRCCANIWGVLHLWYECNDCQYKCHMKCLGKIRRQCALVRVSETPFYLNDICPEVGLAAQGYCCHECKTRISNKRGWREHRLCDYDGRYYCTKCHWDALAVIPARVVHNWDFTERRVCCNCYSFLRLMVKRPVLNLDQLNSQLYQFVVDLASLKKLRSQFLLIKQYLSTCRSSMKEKNKKKMIWSLSAHLIENPTGLFSLQDLIDLHKSTILPVLQEAAQLSTWHIRNCSVCQKKGYYCELCPPRKKEDGDRPKQQFDEDILFPFDDAISVFVCDKCSAVFHRECWMKKVMSSCPRCNRRKERSLLQEPGQ